MGLSELTVTLAVRGTAPGNCAGDDSATHTRGTTNSAGTLRFGAKERLTSGGAVTVATFDLPGQEEPRDPPRDARSAQGLLELQIERQDPPGTAAQAEPQCDDADS